MNINKIVTVTGIGTALYASYKLYEIYMRDNQLDEWHRKMVEKAKNCFGCIGEIGAVGAVGEIGAVGETGAVGATGAVGDYNKEKPESESIIDEETKLWAEKIKQFCLQKEMEKNEKNYINNIQKLSQRDFCDVAELP